jgi:hypothetical protein
MSNDGFCSIAVELPSQDGKCHVPIVVQQRHVVEIGIGTKKESREGGPFSATAWVYLSLNQATNTPNSEVLVIGEPLR